MIVAVADTGPIIHLDEIDALQLLSSIDHVLLPQTVYDELAAGTVPSALSDIKYELVEADSATLDVELDPGETAALVVASERAAVLRCMGRSGFSCSRIPVASSVNRW